MNDPIQLERECSHALILINHAGYQDLMKFVIPDYTATSRNRFIVN